MATDEMPMFDDDWVAQARHHELSITEMKQLRRSQRRAARRVRRRRLLKRIGVVVLLVAGGVWIARSWNSTDSGTTAGHWVDDVNRIWSAKVSGDRPTPTYGDGTRVLPEVAPAAASGQYAFLNAGDGTSPVTYDPCRPVRFVVNPRDAPTGHRAMIEAALAEMSTATGLALDLVGETDEPPAQDRALHQPDRYGDEWAPVLIAWTDETAMSELSGDTAGIGGSGWTAYDDEPAWYVSGLLYLDTDLGPDLRHHRAVFLHELGHVLGLGHVDDPNEIMHPNATTDELGPGDLAGLAAVGAGDCAGLL